MASDVDARIARTIAAEIAARPGQVAAAAVLLDGGATVPFVARYRKEATSGLDDTQLRTLSDRLSYLRELEARRAAILGSIRDQGKLTPELEAGIAGAANKAALEDLYLPYKPKRRSKAAIAREKGLSPLAEAILADRPTPPESLAAAYLSDEVPDAKEALSGARDILTERLAENADLLGRLCAFMQREAFLSARSVKGQEEKGAKFSDYFAHIERWAQVPSHQALAMMRGANEGVLTLDIAPDPEARLKAIDPAAFVDGTFGLPTVRDILAELAKPGRDPRPAFVTATFAEGVNVIGDLMPGMTLEGTVTNVAAFGAFIDIGVHQDGLVHISQLADRFVKDPHEVVKAGEDVRVRVVEVDIARKRIGLSMRLRPTARGDGEERSRGRRTGETPPRPTPAPAPAPSPAQPKDQAPGAIGQALLDALRRN